jgi:NitT/TauT family transport system permease protein
VQRLSGFAVLAIVWELTARSVSNPIFPPLTRVLPALAALLLSGEIVPHILASLQIVLVGFAVASFFGITLGLAVAEFRLIDTIISPLVDTMRPIAALTIFPLLILAFGLGTSARVFVIFWTAWPPILLNTVQAIRKVDVNVLEAAQLDGAGRGALLRFFKIPLAGPFLLTGLRIGMGTGWISLVASEMLGSSRGLGFSILAYSQTFRFPEMYAVIILIALLGLCMNLSLGLAQNLINESEER